MGRSSRTLDRTNGLRDRLGHLEGDLKKFMDSAKEGAVLVSFGSSLKPDQMPPEKIQVFIDTFKQLGMKVA